MYLMGQIFGIIATVIIILRPQFRSRVNILLSGILINLLNGTNFLILDPKGSAAILCLVAIIQSVIAIQHDRKNTSPSRFETIIFLILYIACGIWGIANSVGFQLLLSVRMLLELFPVIGALMFMLSVFAENAQKTRFYLLLNGLSWIIYTFSIGSTSFFSSLVSTGSSLFALMKYRSRHTSSNK